MRLPAIGLGILLLTGCATTTTVEPSRVDAVKGPRAVIIVPFDASSLPPAEQWMTQVNDAMAGGHCFGFSVLSLRMFPPERRKCTIENRNLFVTMDEEGAAGVIHLGARTEVGGPGAEVED